MRYLIFPSTWMVEGKALNMHLRSLNLCIRGSRAKREVLELSMGTNSSVRKPRLILNNLPVIGISIFACFAHVLCNLRLLCTCHSMNILIFCVKF